jgi:nascent polypeptide-associated complex subunit alpha
MRGVNPRQMQQAMRKMGIKQNTINNVSEVIIRTDKEEIVLTGAEVVCIDMQGSKNYQISGIEEIRPLGSAPAAGAAVVSFPNEDIELVMSQTGCDRETAVAALKSSDGQPAEAIIKIVTG